MNRVWILAGLLGFALIAALPLAHAQQIDPEGQDAFSQPLSGIDSTMLASFNYGRGLFQHDWPVVTHADGRVTGLGPDFNATSCSSCHERDGRGRPPEEGVTGPAHSFVLAMQQDGAPDPLYGPQLRDHAIEGAPQGYVRVHYEKSEVTLAGGEVVSLRKPIFDIVPERLPAPSPNTRFGPRMTQQLVGMGLLERIAEADILANADPDDRDGDGISGRANWIEDFSGTRRLGRFGWKAVSPDLATQTITAARNDIGLDLDELPMQDVGAIDRYMELLGVPKRRIDNPELVARGEEVFKTLRCSSCHVSSFKLADDLEAPFAGRAVNAYTDMLLHDMGVELADGTRFGLATEREWRTAPLWGIGRTVEVSGHSFFLHDGRARTLAEAILWHGGEAQSARDGFASLDKADRDALIAFLNSL